MNTPEIIQKHVIVTGRVQGVFFRAATKDEAEKYMITGWVRNKRNGTVESVIKGNKKNIAHMIQWFHRGSPASSVDKVIVDDQDDLSDFADFKIRYR